MITLTEAAVTKIASVLNKEALTFLEQTKENIPAPNYKLRITIEGGGCSGMSYAFGIATEVEEGDEIIITPYSDAVVLVDPISAQYLQGAEIDYVESLEGSRFVIKNPNAQHSCGCGNSFSV